MRLMFSILLGVLAGEAIKVLDPVLRVADMPGEILTSAVACILAMSVFGYVLCSGLSTAGQSQPARTAAASNQKPGQMTFPIKLQDAADLLSVDLNIVVHMVMKGFLRARMVDDIWEVDLMDVIQHKKRFNASSANGRMMSGARPELDALPT